MEAWYREHMFIYDNSILDVGSEGDSLPSIIETAIRQYECRVIIVDNLMTAMSDDMSYDQYRQQTKFVRTLACMAKRYNALIFLIVHPRKKSGSYDFDNDDVFGSSNVTNLVDVVLRYARPRGNDIPADTMEREITIHKNRLTGATLRKGIRLYYDAPSKRISDSPDNFGWSLGWEELDPQLGFRPLPDDIELPFD